MTREFGRDLRAAEGDAARPGMTGSGAPMIITLSDAKASRALALRVMREPEMFSKLSCNSTNVTYECLLVTNMHMDSVQEWSWLRL